MVSTNRRGPRREQGPRAAGALLLAACVACAPAAHAANKDIERLQVQIAGLQGQISDLARALDESLRELRRLNEALAEQNAALKRSMADARVADESAQAALRDLAERVGATNERLQQLTSASLTPPLVPAPFGGDVDGAPAGSAPAPGGLPGATLPAPRELYSQAYADYARGNYDLAIQGFEEYLRSAPGADLADNAQYWIGECLYGKQRYADAVEAWNTLLRDYPSSDKLPDARVKKGMALERLGRRSQALIEYRFVVERYPGSTAARIARDKLNAN